MPAKELQPGTRVTLTRKHGPLRDGLRVRIKAPLITGERNVVGTLMGDGVGTGGVVLVMTDGGPARCTRNEIEVLTDQSPGLEPMRYRLPYGRWTCPDGREILFNREYEPIWERHPGEVARRADRHERPERLSQEMFYSDSTAPWINADSLRRCEQVLAEWGV